MANKYRNEMEIELGGEKILLRPTFENLAAMETKMGGVPYLAFKYGAGVDLSGKTLNPMLAAKSLPPLTDCAQIIYFNQAEKKYDLEQILDLCMQTGIRVCTQVVLFLVGVAAGNNKPSPITEDEKKS